MYYARSHPGTRPLRPAPQHAGTYAARPVDMGAPKRHAATMGKPAGAVQPDPHQFTKSHARDVRLPSPKAPTQPKEKRNPPVPKRDEKPVMGLVSSKNFITTNAIEAILSQARNRPTEEARWTDRQVGATASPNPARGGRRHPAAISMRSATHRRALGRSPSTSSAISRRWTRRSGAWRSIWRCAKSRWGRNRGTHAEQL